MGFLLAFGHIFSLDTYSDKGSTAWRLGRGLWASLGGWVWIQVVAFCCVVGASYFTSEGLGFPHLEPWRVFVKISESMCVICSGQCLYKLHGHLWTKIQNRAKDHATAPFSNYFLNQMTFCINLIHRIFMKYLLWAGGTRFFFFLMFFQLKCRSESFLQTFTHCFCKELVQNIRLIKYLNNSDFLRCTEWRVGGVRIGTQTPDSGALSTTAILPPPWQMLLQVE